MVISMADISLIPTNGYNNGNCWGGDFIGAAIGGALGSAWGGGGWGNRGGWNGPANTGIAENAVLDSLNSVRDSQNNNAMALLAGQSRSEMTACQGFNGINTAILTSAANNTNWTNQGFANMNQLQQRTLFDLSNTTQQVGFGLNNQIVQQGFDTRQAIGALSAQNAECCCTIRQEMAAGFAAMSAQMAADREAMLRDKVAELTNKNNLLETAQMVNNSNLAQSAYLRSIIPATTTGATTPAA